MDTMHTTISVTIAEAEIAQVLCEEIDISEADNSEGIGVGSLDWSNELLKNHDCVVLRVVEVVLLGLDSKVPDFVISHGLKNNHLARHVECLHPFAKLIEMRLGDSRIFLVDKWLDINNVSV